APRVGTRACPVARLGRPSGHERRVLGTGRSPKLASLGSIPRRRAETRLHTRTELGFPRGRPRLTFEEGFLMSATLKHHSFTFDPLAAWTFDTALVPAPKAGRLQRVVGFRVKAGASEGASEGFLRA